MLKSRLVRSTPRRTTGVILRESLVPKLGFIATLLAFVLCAMPSSADNLVDGGDFDIPSDVLGWDNGFENRAVARDPRDVHSSSDSGSLKFTDSNPAVTSGLFAVRRCFLVTPGLAYRVSAQTMVPAGQPKTTEVGMFAWYSATSNCSTAHILREAQSNDVVVTGTWQDLSIEDTVAPEFAHSVLIFIGSRKQQAGGSIDVLFDDIAVNELTGACEAAPDTLCLTDNRFSVTVDWLTPFGTSGVGTAVPMTLDSGLFWFFEPSNLEVLIKVLDVCAFAPDFWVYFAATTDVNFRLTVTDTQTGAIRQYLNPQGVRAQATADSSAFPCL